MIMKPRKRDSAGYLRWARRAAALLAAVAISGCGNNLSQVSGVVTINGKPLRGGDDVRATVYFQPTSSDGTTAIGLLDENGRYQLSSGSQQGVAPGEYVVTVSATQLVRSKAGQVAGGRRITDATYASANTSGLKFTVQPGVNAFDIPLESRPGGSK
jgi:hypothetical protein